ncbi:MAG: hypothetical protein WCK39_06065, partial [Methanomassiliicoccales archaeon]
PADSGGSAIRYYEIYRADGSGSEICLGSSVGTSYDDSRALGGQTYNYFVKAVNSHGLGPSSIIDSANVIDPWKPTGLTALTVGSPWNPPYYLHLNWTAPVGDGLGWIFQYYILRGDESGKEETLDTSLETSYDDHDTDWQPCFYQVIAFVVYRDRSLLGPASNECYASLGCGATTGLTAAAEPGCIHLNWTAPTWVTITPIIGYTIWRSDRSGGYSLWEPLAEYDGLETNYDDRTVGHQTYYYIVRARDWMSMGLASNEASAGLRLPNAPTGLAATAESGNVIKLTWTAPFDSGSAGIDHYEIWRGDSSGAEVLIGSMNGTSFGDHTVAVGRAYFYLVKAHNMFGPGPASNEVAILVGRPGAPTGLTTGPGPDHIHLAWTAPTVSGAAAVIEYDIWRGGGSGAESFLAIAEGTNYDDHGVAVGQVYYYFVKAHNVFGPGPASQEASACLQLPGMPTGLTAAIFVWDIRLAWAAPADSGSSAIQTYEIWRGDSSGTESLLDISEETCYDDYRVEGACTYFYSVKAVNAQGAGPASNEVSACLRPPGPPTGLTTVYAQDCIRLAWTEPSDRGSDDIQYYEIWRGDRSGAEIILANSNVAGYDDHASYSPHKYYYFVRAVNAYGAGPASNEISKIVGPPDAPIGLDIDITWYKEHIARLSWTVPADNGSSSIQRYEIWRGDSSGTESLLDTSTATRYDDNSVHYAEQAYYYFVKAVNAQGAGPASVESRIFARPGHIDGLTASNIGDGWVRLVWDPFDYGCSDAVRLFIWRGYWADHEAKGWSGIRGQDVATIRTAEMTSYCVHNSLFPPSTYMDEYFYLIKAENEWGTSFSDEIVFRIRSDQAIAGPSDLSAIQVGNCVQLSWSPPPADPNSPVQYYEIHRGDGFGGGGEVFYARTTGTNYFDDKHLTFHWPFRYFVVAVDAKGRGGISNEALIILFENDPNDNSEGQAPANDAPMYITAAIGLVALAAFVLVGRRKGW